MKIFKQLNQKLNQTNFDDTYFNFLSIFILSVIIFILGLNLNYSFLWYDEAITFWIAKGINPDSLPNTGSGDLFKCLYYNKFFNLDPCGFSILLHLWSKINDNHYYLRALPFIIYLMFLYYLIKVLYYKFEDLSLSILLSIFITILFSYYTSSYELRGYSMELLTIVLLINFLIYNKHNLKKIFLNCFILSILMTSRYSSIVIVFVSITIIFLASFKKIDDLKNKIKLFVLIYLPFIIITSFIYFYSYETQKTFSDTLPYLVYLKDNPKYIFELKNLIFISNLIYFIILLTKFNPEFKNLILFTVIINFIFIFLSFLGKYPWDPLNSRSNVISLPIILTFILCIKNRLIQILKKLYVKLAILMLLVFTINNYSKRLYKRYDKPIELYSDILSINFSKNPKILVDRWSNLSVRYLYEYGSLKSCRNKHHYPKNFSLLCSKNKYLNTVKKTDIWYKEQVKKININNYDVLIIPEMSKYSFKNKLNLRALNQNNILFLRNDNYILNISLQKEI